jgi:hypothetical protein
MERIEGDSNMRAGEGNVDAHMHLSVSGKDGEEPRSASERLANGIRERVAGAGDRAGDVADTVREGISERVGRVGIRFEERTGLLGTIRSHPLAATGLAFSVGFLVAAATGSDDRSWVVERLRRQLRAMLLSGLSAAVAHELRTLVGGDEGLGRLVASLLDGEEDDDDYPFDV